MASTGINIVAGNNSGEYIFDDVQYTGKGGKLMPTIITGTKMSLEVSVPKQTISFYKKTKSGEKKDETMLNAKFVAVNVHKKGDHDNAKLQLADITEQDPDKEILHEFAFEVASQKALAEFVMQKVVSEANKDDMKSTVDIWAGSWNFGDANPGDDLSGWIEQGHDMYCIGCQESSWNGADCEKVIGNLIINALGVKYAMVEHRSMGAIRIFIAARKSLLPFITSVMSSDEATGIAHVASNKGGVAVYLQYLSSSFCFVASHLAAHQEKVEERNGNVEEILKGVKVGPYAAMDLMACSDHVFWLGDLNYRIDMERDDVINLAKANNYAKLYEADQLHKEMSANRVFQGFVESAPQFPPSYKFEVGTRNYATEKMRVPSWCDRVLVYSRDSTCIKMNKWTSCDEPKTSDHAPVYATYSVIVNGYVLPSDAELLPVVKGDSNAKKFIKVVSLKGANMLAQDRGNSSDPYVVFHGPLIADEAKTDVVKKTLFPEWNMAAFPLLKLTVPLSMRRWLDGQYLVASIWDSDVGSKDDAMGWAAIPLTALSSQNTSSFNVPVYYFGKQEGTLSGELQLV